MNSRIITCIAAACALATVGIVGCDDGPDTTEYIPPTYTPPGSDADTTPPATDDAGDTDADTNTDADTTSDAGTDSATPPADSGTPDTGTTPDAGPDAAALTCLPTGTITVTSSNTNFTSYTVNGVENAPLTFCRGNTYTFDVTSTGALHPFWIETAPTLGGTDAYNTGMTPATQVGVKDSTPLVFAVPTTAPAKLYYQCGNHQAMSGVITIIDP